MVRRITNGETTKQIAKVTCVLFLISQKKFQNLTNGYLYFGVTTLAT